MPASILFLKRCGTLLSVCWLGAQSKVRAWRRSQSGNTSGNPGDQSLGTVQNIEQMDWSNRLTWDKAASIASMMLSAWSHRFWTYVISNPAHIELCGAIDGGHVCKNLTCEAGLDFWFLILLVTCPHMSPRDEYNCSTTFSWKTITVYRIKWTQSR